MSKKSSQNINLKVLVQVQGGIADVITNSSEIEVFLIDYDNEDCCLNELDCYTKDLYQTLKKIREKNNG